MPLAIDKPILVPTPIKQAATPAAAIGTPMPVAAAPAAAITAAEIHAATLDDINLLKAT